MPCRKVPGIFFLAAFPLLLFLMASGAAALGISDGTFSPQSGVERGKAYSQGVLLTNSPNRENHFVVTVGGDIGAWVTSISPSDFNLTANQQQLITLAINVPANATFGSHTGTVTATATDPAAGGAVIEATRGNLHAEVIGSVSCGDGVCDSGESSSNCCTDCPSTAGGGVSYGSWYCAGSGARARIVSNSSYVCNSQTKAYEYVTTNTTEASQCEAGTVCSNGSCIINQTAPVCGNNICESGESSSNCCTDCPSNAGGAGAAYGSWYCKDSATKARLLTTVTSVCDNQTKTYKTVTANSTETQACPSGQACSNGDCASAVKKWIFEGSQMYLEKDDEAYFSGKSSSSACLASYSTYNNVKFLTNGSANTGGQQRRFDLSGAKSVSVDVGGLIGVVHLLASGNIGNTQNSGTATVTVKFAYSDGTSSEVSGKVPWDWTRAYDEESANYKRKAISISDPCRTSDVPIAFYTLTFSNPHASKSVGSISLSDSWASDYPYTNIVALTVDTNATSATNATRSEFYWNIDWIDLNAATSAREDSLSVSPGQSVSGKFAYTMWNGPVCRGGCDCIDEIVLGVEGEPKHCFYAGIPWCYPGQSGETKFSFAAPEKAGTYSLYYAASQSYTCEDAYSTYKASTGRKPAGKLVVSGTSAACTDSDGGNDNYAAGYVTYNGVGYKDYCTQPVKRADGTVALDSVSSCSGSDCSVFEYWCGGTQGIESQSYSCPQGCADGACIYANATQNCVRAKPTIKVTPESQIGVAGETSKYVIEVFNNDNQLCTPSDISLTFPNYDAESKGAYAIRSLNDFPGGIIPPTKPGASYKLTMLADVLPNTPKGTYYITLVAEHQGASRYTGAAYSTAVQPSIVVSDRALELSLATDKSSYTQGEQVRISSKTHVSGNLVDAYVKGYAVRPDGGLDELVFAGETCKQPICKSGEPCIQVACPVQTGYLNAFYTPGMEGAYYIKASASYGNSLAESSAKFFVGTQKKARLSAWLENYQNKAGDTVKVFAKLTDERGEPVLGADVSARIHWAGNVRPVYRELVGIESAAAAKRLEQTAVQAVEKAPVRSAAVTSQAEAVPAGSASAVQATQVAQAVEVAPVRTAIPATGYAIATIASSVERQAAATPYEGETREVGIIDQPVVEATSITYAGQTSIREVSAQLPSKEVAAYPEPMPEKKIAPRYGYVKLEYNPKSGYYEGSYSIPSDAQSGTYKVAVSASTEGQHLQESTSFTLGGEDYLSFENKAKKFASDGDYKECVDNYLKAADRLSADQYRMFLDIEKAGICARLGNLPNSFYKDIGKIVEKAAGEGRERYVLLGIASQYYELGGEYRISRELLGKAASGLEDISGVLDKEQSILAKSVIAKYYALLGEGSKSASYYKEAADLLVANQHYSSESFLQNLFAAKFYAKAGDLYSSRKQYLIAADDLSGKSSGSDALISAFIAGDSYEKAGEPEKAKEQYTRAVGLAAPGSYSAGDSFFAYSARGKSYERLGEKQKAKEMYEKGLERLLSKQDAESYYFASGLSGYLGDYGKSKELCRKQFEQSLSEESNIGKLTFMNAYCYSVLGDGLRAKKGCDLNSITLQGDTMVMEILEPLPPPVSYCSQSTDAKRTSSCGNGAVDAGESPENCCADTGCAFGDTCSKALNKCVKPVKEIPQESILEVLLRLEDARIKLDTLGGKALAISKYYAGKDQPKSDAWAKAANVFGESKSKIDNIKKDLKDNREKITEETLEGIRQKLEDVRGSLKQAVDAILEAV